MIVPDINLLIFAYNDGSPFHDDSRCWWDGLLNGTEIIGMPWVVSTGFIRLIAGPTVLIPPWSPAAAVQQVREWLDLEHIITLNPGGRHLELLEQCLGVAGATGTLAPDAHIAALALEYGAEVHTHNARDFRRFPGLMWRNPLTQR